MAILALLRSINVGNHNRVKMVDLKLAMEARGFSNLVTYLQSGNVLFDKPTRPNEISHCFELVFADLGVKSMAILRTSEQMAGIVRRNPFERETGPDKLKFVTYFAQPLEFEVPRHSKSGDAEVLLQSSTELYWATRPIEGRSGPGSPSIPSRSAAFATTRNWIVTQALAEMMKG